MQAPMTPAAASRKRMSSTSLVIAVSAYPLEPVDHDYVSVRQNRIARMLEDSGPLDAIVDPRDAAESVGLTYVSDEEPGIKRLKSGRGFRYLRPGGGKVEDAPTLERIRKLAIPPAWTDVWICSKASGHIQATGRDAKN